MRAAGKICFAAGLVCLFAALFLVVYTRLDSYHADRTADAMIREFENRSEDRKKMVEDYVRQHGEPGADTLFTYNTGGQECIGILEIPSLGIKLPVQSSWTNSRMNISPCRYGGSPKKGSFMIAGFGYSHQFGLLKLLKENDEIRFTDIEGTVYYYRVSQKDASAEKSIRNAEADNWDLSLFLCTAKAETKLTVRCDEEQKKPQERRQE
jgi:sortase A